MIVVTSRAPANSPPPATRESAARELQRHVALTPRWTPLIPHVGQALYYWSPVRFNINPSGRRSGKTELAKRKVVRELVRRRAWPAKILCGAPTFGQARDIFWDDLKALVPSHWVAKISETRLEITTHWGATVRVFGFDRPRRVEGVPWDWIFIDEIADCPRNCFRLNLRPALSTRGREGRADLIGVPDEIGRNQAEYESLWEVGLKWNVRLGDLSEDDLAAIGADPEICSYHWPSADILDPKEIASAKRGGDELAYKQEYVGAFVRSGGLAVPRFDYAAHVRKEHCEHIRWLPLDWSFDFGTRWVAHVIGQVYRGNVWILDEVAQEASSTEVATVEFIDRARANHWLSDATIVRVFGDAAGHRPGSNIGESDYKTIRRMFGARQVKNVEWMQLRVNPLVKDTVNAVRTRTASADGMIHLHVHPRCKRLINDLKTAPWPDGSNNLKDYHWLAALRYYLFSMFGGNEPVVGVGGPLNPALAGSGGNQPPRPRSRNVP